MESHYRHHEVLCTYVHYPKTTKQTIWRINSDYNLGQYEVSTHQVYDLNTRNRRVSQLVVKRIKIWESSQGQQVWRVVCLMDATSKSKGEDRIKGKEEEMGRTHIWCLTPQTAK